MVIAAPAFAQLPDPTKNLPNVPVPTVQVPVPTVQVPVPTVPVPVPTVQVPVPTVQVPVPTVQVPVPTPSAPQGAPPSGSGGGGGGGGGADSGGGSPTGGGSGSGGTSGGGSGASGAGSSGGGSGASGSRAGGESGSRTGTGTAKRRCSTPGACSGGTRGPRVPADVDLAGLSPSERRVVRRDRRLVETVTRARGCLDDLPAEQRRVLRLRAGVGPEPARSRASVARRLDVSVRKVARVERAGLRKLRVLAQRGRCVASVAPPTARGNAEPVASAVQPRSGGGQTADRGDGTSRRSPGTDGAAPDATPGAGGVEGATQTNLPTATTPPGSIDLLIPMIGLALAALAFLFVRTLRRQGAVTPAPEPPPAAPAGERWDEPPPGLDR